MSDMTYAGWFAARAERSPERPALTFEGRTWTFRELLHEVDCLAAGLRDRGLRQGDRLAYIGENHAALLMSLLATSRLGAVLLPISFRLAGAELEYILADSGAVAVVADPARAAVVDALLAHPATDDAATDRPGEVAPGAVTGSRLRVSTRICVDEPHPGWDGFDEVIAGTAPLDAPAMVGNDDLALLLYTSGTTGHPKGAMLSHANLWWNDEMLFSIFHTTAEDTTLAVAPLFHIAGLNVTIGMTWKRGGRVVVQRRFDPAAFLRTIADERVNTLLGVPAMFLAVMRHPDFEAADLSSLRLMLCGGAPVPPQVVTTFEGRGVNTIPAYGLTECAPIVAVLAPADSLTKPGSCGKPPIGLDLKLMADGVEQTGAEAEGEIWARGANITRGYWNNPAATALAIDDAGWFRTGDVGRRDAEGFIYVVDRIKDVVITGGENVYPAEVEHVLLDHPGVAEVAVIGVADEVWGEAVTAVVVPAGETAPTVDELRALAEGRIARFKMPREVRVIDALPRNAQGKVLKTELRDRFA